MSTLSQDSPYPDLFAPLDLGGVHLKNRIAHASISTRLGAPGALGEGYRQYCEARAHGGAAMLITEPVGLGPWQSPTRLPTWGDAHLPDLQRLADAVRAHDCHLIAQIQDPGRGRHVPGRASQSLAPSALPDDLSGTMPRAMETAEVQTWVAMVADRASRLQRAGFSGVELSACHGHLFHLFLSPRANHREDRYGGDAQGRARWLAEMVQAIRQSCGEAFVIGVKLPGDDGLADSIPPAEAARLVEALLDQCLPSYLAFAQGAHARTLEMHLPDASGPRMPYVDLTRRLAAHARGVPVMGLGRITDPAEAQYLVASGGAALVGLGRPLITDPDWPRKASEGQAGRIRYCVSCNTCWKTIVEDRPIACDNNPRLAARTEGVALAPAPAPKKLLVIGSGIAGLEAAWVAASRGHQVVVHGASAEVGGKARVAASLPALDSISSIYDYQYERAREWGVRFVMGHRLAPGEIAGLDFDEAVLATGATPHWPLEFPPDWQEGGLIPDLGAVCLEMQRHHQRQAGTALVWDLDPVYGTYAAVLRLASLFERVVLVTPREQVAGDCSLVTRQSVLKRLHEAGVEVWPLTQLRWNARFEEDASLDCESVFGGQVRTLRDLALVTYATPRVPDTRLLAALEATGRPVHRIGDCRVPADALAATSQGFSLGATL